jgi:hypothetical protein
VRNSLLGFVVGFTGLLAGCTASVLISSHYSLNGFWQGVLGVALGGLGTYLPLWIWSKLTDK